MQDHSSLIVFGSEPALEGVSRHGRAAPVCGRLLGRREDGAGLCAALGISRRRNKIFERYKDCGVAAFTDRRRPAVSAGESAAGADRGDDVRLKAEYPGWGRRRSGRSSAAGPRVQLRRSVRSTRCSTATAWSSGLPPRPAAAGTALSRPTEPNFALWCADYKGEFPARQSQYCYPLTITDFASRYLLTCEALSRRRSIRVYRLRADVPDSGSPVRFAPTTGCPLRRGMRSTG